MITGEIKLYDEPAPITYTTYYSSVPVRQTPEERAAWEALCESELDKAKCIFKVGDTVSTKNNPAAVITILEFIENIADMQKFNGSPCVVRGKNLAYVTAQPMQYALNEFNMSTHRGVAPKDE